RSVLAGPPEPESIRLQAAPGAGFGWLQKKDGGRRPECCCSATGEQGNFSLGQVAELAHRQVRIKDKLTHLFTVQAFYMVTHGGKHAPNLMVTAFVDGQQYFTVADALQLGRFGRHRVVVEQNAALTALLGVGTQV